MRNDLNRIVGNRLCLRLVTLEDAQYIFRLRTDPANNTHLSKVDGTIADQRDWIEGYKVREAAGEELYYVIECMDGTPCGVVRLYEITKETFTWGSWILTNDKPAKAALESAVLSFSVGFKRLGLSKAHLDARLDNTHAIAFYQRFGMTTTGSDAVNIYFEYSRDRFLHDYDTHLSVITADIKK